MTAKTVQEMFWYWIRERESIRRKREAGDSAPWTKDPILGYYHFCNVRREDDRGTKEIRQVVRSHGVDYWDLPWVYTAARLFNKASTLDYLLERGDAGWEMLRDLKDNGCKVFHTAYVVSTCGQKMDKVDYVEEVVLMVRRKTISTKSLQGAYNDLRMINGMGTFLAGQVVADLKNHMYLEHAPDWITWSVIGPGSKKGLEYLFPNSRVNEGTYDALMKTLVLEMPGDIMAMRLHMQDLQNCLCEFSKYMRHLGHEHGRKRPYHFPEVKNVHN